MRDRLRPLDVALLAADSPRTPMHVATLDIFDPARDASPDPDGGDERRPDGADDFDYDRLVGLIYDRIAFLPRFRQRVRWVPGRISGPIWVDDDEFDITFHVRRSALPGPGTMSQLRDLTARIMSRPLDRNRPLWETYLIEGVSKGRYAVMTKSHQALVDGATVDLGQLIVDDTPSLSTTTAAEWRPEQAPTGVELIAAAVADSLTNPAAAFDGMRAQFATLQRASRQISTRMFDLADAVSGRHRAPSGPLSANLSEQRRYATVDTPLSAYRKVRKAHGGSVNDVILACIAGGIRAFLQTRAEPVLASTTVKCLVPMSVTDDEFAEPTSLGSQVTPHLINLPVGEASPVIRLHQVSYAFKAHKETGRAVAANRLAEIPGFAPSTFHALGARVAASVSARSYALLIVNVPGPQFPLYAAGARMVASYPVLPLMGEHALAIGATSYDGRIFYGLHADRDAMADLDVLGTCIVEALDELVESSEGRLRAPRGRVTRTSVRDSLRDSRPDDRRDGMPDGMSDGLPDGIPDDTG